MKVLKHVSLFVEGPEDSRFLQDVIFAWYGVKVTVPPEANNNRYNAGEKTTAGELTDIIHCGGKSNIAKTAPIFTHSRNIMGFQNILFLDADSPEKDEQIGGLKNTSAYIKRLVNQHSIVIDKVFIFPNNEAETGDLETILEQIAVEKSLFDCWKQYEFCIAQNALVEGKEYRAPSAKTKLYAYTEAVLRNPDKAGGARRKYNNKFWNLNPDDNLPHLQALKTFLDSIFL